MASRTQPLAIYLHDHLAGAAYGLDLIKSIRDNYRGQELGDFAATLNEEIAAHNEVLHSLASQFGPASNVVKDSVAWLADRVSRFKLAHRDPTGLGLFEAIRILDTGNSRESCVVARPLGACGARRRLRKSKFQKSLRAR